MPKPYRMDQNSEFKEENGGFSDGTLKQVANHKAVSSLRIAKAIFIGDAAVGKTSLGLFSFSFQSCLTSGIHGPPGLPLRSVEPCPMIPDLIGMLTT